MSSMSWLSSNRLTSSVCHARALNSPYSTDRSIMSQKAPGVRFEPQPVRRAPATRTEEENSSTMMNNQTIVVAVKIRLDLFKNAKKKTMANVQN